MRYRLSDTQARFVGGKLDAVDELHSWPRVIREEQVAVEIDVVAEACDLRCGCDSESGLEHAAEHHAQVQCTRRVRHADRLANPPRLRELDVDPVSAPGAGGNVGEPVAVLVDVDRDWRFPLQPDTVRVAGRERLL